MLIVFDRISSFFDAHGGYILLDGRSQDSQLASEPLCGGIVDRVYALPY